MADIYRKRGRRYVPDDFLCHGDTGYGDYIIFKVGADGKIEGWRQPEIEADSWPAGKHREERT